MHGQITDQEMKSVISTSTATQLPDNPVRLSTPSPSNAHYQAIIGQVERRNGDVVPFDYDRIVHAIYSAMSATGEGSQQTAEAIAHQVTGKVMQMVRKDKGYLPTIEGIQDLVEEHLILNDFTQTAKAYILYRDQKARERRERHEAFIKQFDNHELHVRKAGGEQQPFNLEKIENVFDRVVRGYEDSCTFEEFMRAFKRNVVADIQTSDINRLMIKTCLDLVTVENIAWQHVAARLLLENVYKQAMRNRGMHFVEIYSSERYIELFDEYIEKGHYYKKFYDYYSREDIHQAGEYLGRDIDDTYEYTTVLSLSNRYLLNPNGVVKELPQEMYMSVALFLAIPEPKETRLAYAFKLYDACSQQLISLPTPTLLNSRTNFHQLASCFKINVDDDLRSIYHTVENVAQISKLGGGLGVYLGHIRSREASIRGIKGASGGVSPWIKVLNDTGVAVNQLGARMGAVSVTIDVFHRDIYDFLDLQTETGDIRNKSFDVFPAISIPDLFMQRVRDGENWTLVDPHEIRSVYGKSLEDHFNEDFNEFYKQIEQDDRLEMKMVVPAKELFKKALRTVVETGMPYMFFRDTVNRLNPNAHAGNVYSTQLCTEICQNTSPSKFKSEALENGEVKITYDAGDLVSCNLASLNVAKVHDEETIAWVMPVLARALDHVITLNYYPLEEAKRTAFKYRPIGIGYLGLAEYLATRFIKFDSVEAREEVKKLFERYGYHTYRASVDLAKERGAYELFQGSEPSKGVLLGRTLDWYKENTGRAEDWEKLFADMSQFGLRFGYHTAPAPNTSTAGVVGTTAALLPIYKRFFIENNMSSPSIRVAPKLTKENYPYYQEYISLNMNGVIDLVAEIYKWVDQSISFEWMINPANTSPQDLFSFYFRAWEKGIKTVYYVRSLSVKAESTLQEAVVPEVSTKEPVDEENKTEPIFVAALDSSPGQLMSAPGGIKVHDDGGDRNVCESCSG